jgi:hypothetical protein
MPCRGGRSTNKRSSEETRSRNNPEVRVRAHVSAGAQVEVVGSGQGKSLSYRTQKDLLSQFEKCPRLALS